jgi:hypothetical protein
VHWFDRTRSSGSRSEGSPPERLGGTDFFRTALKQDSLDYIFSRIRLLASGMRKYTHF